MSFLNHKSCILWVSLGQCALPLHQNVFHVNKLFILKYQCTLHASELTCFTHQCTNTPTCFLCQSRDFNIKSSQVLVIILGQRNYQNFLTNLTVIKQKYLTEQYYFSKFQLQSFYHIFNVTFLRISNVYDFRRETL